MAGYSINSLADGCYPGTTVLVNKFSIQNQANLDAVEGTLVPAKAALWAKAPPTDTFDFAHYCQLHRFLFGDIYEWAGKPRVVNMAKKGTQFCPAEQIEARAASVFGYLAQKHYFTGLPKDEFVDALADFYKSTNELHPFREGNGRTQRAFFAQLADHAGYSMDFSRIEADDLMIATIQLAAGVDDFLKQIFHVIISELP